MLNNSFDRANLSIKNLWWLATFTISSNKDFTWTWVFQRYKISKNIWWTDVEKKIIEK
jgi:hypothetical protein